MAANPKKPIDQFFKVTNLDLKAGNICLVRDRPHLSSVWAINKNSLYPYAKPELKFETPTNESLMSDEGYEDCQETHFNITAASQFEDLVVFGGYYTEVEEDAVTKYHLCRYNGKKIVNLDAAVITYSSEAKWDYHCRGYESPLKIQILRKWQLKIVLCTNRLYNMSILCIHNDKLLAVQKYVGISWAKTSPRK